MANATETVTLNENDRVLLAEVIARDTELHDLDLSFEELRELCEPWGRNYPRRKGSDILRFICLGGFFDYTAICQQSLKPTTKRNAADRLAEAGLLEFERDVAGSRAYVRPTCLGRQVADQENLIPNAEEESDHE
jgi:hypothetical protein